MCSGERGDLRAVLAAVLFDPEARDEQQEWPELTPAGVKPDVDEDEFLHRSRV